MPGPGDVNVVNVITLVAIVSLVLSVALFTKAITYDLVGLPIRAWAETKYTKASKIYKLATCWWCLAVWISLAYCSIALIAASVYLGNWWPMATLPFLWPAVAYAAGWVIDRTVG